MHIGECQHSQQPTSLVDLLSLPATDELQHLGEGWGGGGIGAHGRRERSWWGRRREEELVGETKGWVGKR